MTNRDVLERFDALYWHDAEFLSIWIDRSATDSTDTVALRLRWPDAEESSVVFADCFAFDAAMNFNVDALETIRSASCFRDHPRLTEERDKWTALGVDAQDLWAFVLETNSTASKLTIIARGFALEP